MKAKSTRKRRSRKSSDSPLSKHPRGYWCKRYKLTGTKIWKMAYFQKVADDPEGKASLDERTRVVSVFKFAWDERLIKSPVDYGTAFDRAPRKLIRQARNEKAARMFEADEIRRLIDGAGVHLRAMILLGCNGGFGNSDCEQLPIEAVDLDGGWVRFPRPKTQVPRAFPLWAETADALRASLAKRPTPKSEADAHLFFITKYGASWHKATERGPVVLQFRRLLDDLGLHKHGRGFYALRHAFETIGGESKDQVAVDAIMGHIREDVASNYRERISDDRLRAVVDTVQAWLFADMAGDVHRAPAAGDNRPVRLRVVGGQAASVPSTQHGLG